MLKKSFIIFHLYIYIKLFIWMGRLVRTKIFKEKIPSTINIKLFILSFIYISIAIFLSSLLLMVSLRQLSLASSNAHIIASSQLYMNMDLDFFGIEPRLWVINFFSSPFWDFILTYVYRKLTWFFAFVFIGLLLFNKTNFRKYLVTFFLSPIIAFPLWFALPAISPNEMYRQNVYLIPSNNSIQEQYKKTLISPHLKEFLYFIEENVENPKQEYPLVSTNPSMHVCWGFLVTYFAILLWRPLAIVFVPWFVLNMISTLYVLQHYVIDLPAGILCALITIFLTNVLFNYERKYYTGSYKSLYFLDVFQADIKRLINICSAWIFKNKKTTRDLSLS